MPLYTVFAPPLKPGETAPDPVRFVFVKEGFCWPALFVPELWLLFRRLWLVFVLYLAASLVISVIGEKVGGPLPWTTLILMHLLFALEGNVLRRWKLSASGYALVGVAEGKRAEAELRFFSQWQPPAPAPSAEPAGEPPAAPSVEAAAPTRPVADIPAAHRDSAEAGVVVGLFPTPEGTS